MTPAQEIAWGIVPTLLAGIGVIAIYSFLWRENRMYRVFEHAFIGVSIGVGVTYTIRNYLLPNLLSPLWRSVFLASAFRSALGDLPDETIQAVLASYSATAVHPQELFWLLPAAFGSLYYTIYSRRFNWMARLVIGYGLGVAGGAAFEGFFNQFLPEIFATFRPFVVFNEGVGINWSLTVLSIVVTLGTFTTMSYFIFTVSQKRPVLKQSAHTGRLLMMVSFGAIFGSTVTARLALLIERLQFMYGDWLPAWKRLFMIVLGISSGDGGG